MASSQDETAGAEHPSATPPGEAGAPFARVLELVRFLRVNCPWDAAQTPRSLLPYLLEEAHEVAHRVEDGDDAALASELGDLMLHVAFQIVLGEERRSFDASAVADRVVDKMRRRHPHLFGLGEQRDWEALKADERAAAAAADAGAHADADAPPHSLLDDLAPGLDPLTRAHRIQDRVAAVGFDWDDASGAFAKVREEVEEVHDLASAQRSPAPPRESELDPAVPGTTPGEASESTPGAVSRLEEEIGDLLFAVVNYARLSGVHAGLALGAANRKFVRRFQALERLAPERGVRLGEASLQELDRLWDEVKGLERGTD